jgi:hypothetical protein
MASSAALCGTADTRWIGTDERTRSILSLAASLTRLCVCALRRSVMRLVAAGVVQRRPLWANTLLKFPPLLTHRKNTLPEAFATIGCVCQPGARSCGWADRDVQGRTETTHDSV